MTVAVRGRPAVLQRKTAVVTGASRGFGLAMARAFGQAGGSLMLAARDGEAVERAVASLKKEGIRAAGLACDVGDPVQVEELAAHTREVYGTFNIWVNNAAVLGPLGPTVDLPPDSFLEVVNTNLLGVYYGSRVALQLLLSFGGGKLINVGYSGYAQPEAMVNAYASCKAWVRSFTLGLAEEYRNSGVGVYLLHPGPMRTSLLREVKVIRGFESLLEPATAALRRWSSPMDPAVERALWLAAHAVPGRTAPEVSAQGLARLAGRYLRHLFARIRGRKQASPEVSGETVSSGRHARLGPGDRDEAYW